MSDPLKISNLIGRFKSRFSSDGYGSAGSYYASSSNKENEEDSGYKFDFENVDDPANNKLFKLGLMVGLKKDEILEAFDLVLKATENTSQNADFASVILSNDMVKFPDCKDFDNKVSTKDLDRIKNDIPDLCLALNDRFQFFCKYPKTLSLNLYRKFSFQESLEFSTKCPDEYKVFSEMIKEERNNEPS